MRRPFATLLLLGACAPAAWAPPAWTPAGGLGTPIPGSQTGAPAADPTDLCSPQVVVFVNAGDLFRGAPRRDGAPDADALARELARENAEIERLQIAFDALLYCRWTEVRVIRAEAASGRIPAAEAPRRMAAAEARLRRDLAEAARLREQIAARSARIEAAVERIAPGTAADARRERAQRDAPTRAVASAAVTLRLRPDGAAPETLRLRQGTEVALRPAAPGFAFVDAGPASRGYAPAGAFTVLPQRRAEAPAPGPQGELRRLVASNIARRENFAESLDVAERSAASGFEPGTN